MGIFDKARKFLTGPDVTAPLLNLDFSKFDDSLSPLSKRANTEITDTTIGAKEILKGLEQEKLQAVSTARASGQGQLEDAIGAAAREGGIDSGARERASRRSERNIAEAQQGIAGQALASATDLKGSDLIDQQTKQFQTQQLLPALQLQRLAVQSGQDAGNLQSQNIANVQNQQAKRKFGSTIGGIFGPVGGVIGGGLFG